jgi:hypothetical protein
MVHSSFLKMCIFVALVLYQSKKALYFRKVPLKPTHTRGFLLDVHVLTLRWRERSLHAKLRVLGCTLRALNSQEPFIEGCLGQAGQQRLLNTTGGRAGARALGLIVLSPGFTIGYVAAEESHPPKQ